MTSLKRPFAWWRLAESAAGRLTAEPHVARGDAGIDRLVAGSALYGAGRSLVEKTGRAWLSSRTARELRPIVRDLAPPSPADRVRVSGLIATAGSLTALVLHAFEPMRTGWLASILPAAVAIAGVLMVSFADPLSRAIAGRRLNRAQSDNP